MYLPVRIPNFEPPRKLLPGELKAAAEEEVATKMIAVAVGNFIVFHLRVVLSAEVVAGFATRCISLESTWDKDGSRWRVT